MTNTPNITSLTVQCFVAMILPGGMDSLWVSRNKNKGAMFEILERCIFLTDLNIAFYHHPQEFHLLSATRHRNLLEFIKKLNDSLPRLESLTIGPQCYTSHRFLQHVEPMNSFKNFGKLQHLRLAHQMRPGSDDERLPGNSALLLQLLPASSRTIEIDMPKGDIFKFLNQFLQENHGLHWIRDIVVRCATKSHATVLAHLITPEVLLHEWNRSPIIRELYASNLRPRLECMKADYTGGFPCESKICEQCRDMVVWEDVDETSFTNLAVFMASLPGSSILGVSNSPLERSVPC